VPGMFFLPRQRDSAGDMFDRLTMLELLVLAAKLRAGRIAARDGALRCRSLPAAWKMIRLSNSLAELEHDVFRALTRY
jgi:hypothetical protein